MSIFEKILALDRDLFFTINTRWSNSFFDMTLPYLRNAKNWIPFYFFLLIFIPLKHKQKGWFWVLFLIATAAATDLVSSRLIKENIFRMRPCGDLSLAGHVRFLVSYCPQSSSFTSSHAANHFGFAVFFYFTLRNYYSGRKLWWIFLWAFLICYSQVYVGVHYPLDIAGGAVAGGIIGYIFVILFNKHFRLERVPTPTSI
jgi:undecaprenyl-diphosphatase